MDKASVRVKDSAMENLFSRDGALTRVTEAVPGGGWLTAPFHAAAGNATHAAKAAVTGFGTFTATALGGPIGGIIAGIGTAAMSAVVDNYAGKENIPKNKLKK